MRSLNHRRARSGRGKLETAAYRTLIVIAIGGGVSSPAIWPNSAMGQAYPTYRPSAAKGSALSFVYTADNASSLSGDTFTQGGPNISTTVSSGAAMTYPTGAAAANLATQITQADVVVNGSKTSSTTAAGGVYAYTDTNSYNMSLVLAPGSGVSQTNVSGDLFSGASELDMDLTATWQLGSGGFPLANNYPGLVYQFPVAGIVGVGGTDHVILSLNIYGSANGVGANGSGGTLLGSISQDLAINNSSGVSSLSFTNNSLSGTVLLNNGVAINPATYPYLSIQGAIEFKAKNNDSPSFSMLPSGNLSSAPQQTITSWNSTGGGSWASASNFTAGVPNSPASAAVFGSANTAGMGTVTDITLDGSETVGTVAFDSPNTYVIIPGSGGSLIMNNAASGGLITDQSGTHEIAAPVTLASNTTVNVPNSGNSLVFANSAISGPGQLTVTGEGVTLLEVANSYAGGTVISTTSNATDTSSGSVEIENCGALGSGPVTDNGTLAIGLLSGVNSTLTNPISGSGGVNVFVSAGPNAPTLSGANSFTGTVLLEPSSELHLGSATALGAGKLNLMTSSVLDLAGFSPTVASLSGSGTVDNLGQSADSNVNLTVNGVGSSVFSGVIQQTSGQVGLVVAGGGSLTLTNTSTYNGQTTVEDATLILDNTSTGVTPIISSSSGLVMSGGTVQFNASNRLVENFVSTTFESGLTNLTATGDTPGLVDANLGEVTRGAQAVVQFNGPISGVTSPFQMVPASMAATIVQNNGSDYATYGATDWAATTANEDFNAYVVPGSAIADFYTSQGTGAFVQNANTDIVGAGLIAVTASSFTAASVRFNTPNGGLVNFGGNNNTADQFLVSPNFICGGYLVTPNVGANNILISDYNQSAGNNSSINTQDLVASQGASATDLIIWQNNTAGLLVINTGISNPQQAASSLTKAGPGTLVLNASSTYTGNTNIDGGVIEISSNAALGVGSTGNQGFLNLDGGALVAVNTLSLDANVTGGGPVGRSILIYTYGGTLVAATGATLTIDGSVGLGPLISSGALHFGSTETFNTAIALAASSVVNFGLTTGNGTVVLTQNALSNFNGSIDIDAGTLQLGNGKTSSALGNGVNGIANNGNLVFDLPDSTGQTVSVPISGTGGVTQMGGGSTLTLSGFNTYLSPTVINAGTLDIAGLGSLPNGGQVTNNANLNIEANSNAGNISGKGTTNIIAGVTLSANNIAQGQVVNDGSLMVSGTAMVSSITGTGTLTAGTAAGTPGVLVQLTPGGAPTSVSSLTINPGATLDITTNTVTISYAPAPSPLPIIEAELAAGTIISSDLPSGYAIGYVDGSVDKSSTVPAGTLVLMPALLGDTNLDGTVNLTDLLSLLNNYGLTGQDWAHGDFNYDGAVNLTDLLALLNNYGLSSGGAASIPTAVPEPAAGGVFLGLLGAVGLRRCSRRIAVH